MSNLPIWLVESREDVLRSEEWNDLTKNIYDAVDQHLAQSHVQYFTDLSDAEKSLLLERAARSLKASNTGKANPYERLNRRVSDALDKNVNGDVSNTLLKEDPYETKSDLILNKICEGMIALLRKWPDQKYKLHAFINQPLPSSIRFFSWHLYLNNPNYRQKFLNDASGNLRSIASSMDGEIQRYCDTLVRRIPASNEMMNSNGNLSAMKAILSYHHLLLANKRDLADSEYYYVIPIVLSHEKPLSRMDKSYEKSLSMLVEMYLSFQDQLPPTLRQVYLNSSTRELEPWFRQVEDDIREFDRPLYNHIRTILYPSDTPMATTDDPYLLAFLKKICYPWFKYLFVGCLACDPLLFVWDQYLITSDVPNFHDRLIPAIATAILITMRDFLLKCRMASEMENVLENKTNLIITRQLQSVIIRFFLSDFKNRISQYNFGPVIDPTEGRHWSRFNGDQIPQAANKPEQRMTERERNENLQRERQLREELMRRQESERQMQAKIDLLERELDRVKSQPLPPPPISRTTQPTRLPTPAEKYLVNPRTAPGRPPEERMPEPKANSPIHDLLRKISQTANRVAHGEGKNSKALNEQTKNDIRVHKLDLKMAERQVIGRTLEIDEWNNLSEADKVNYSEQMLNAVKARIQDRYSNQRK